MGQTGTDTLSLDGNGKLEVNANCTGGTIYLRGNWDVTDSGSATIVYDDNTENIAAINTNIPQTLNLTASGNIGIDWANVENQGAIGVSLTGTTIFSASNVILTTASEESTADTILGRSVSFVEDTADADSLAKVVLMAGHSNTTTNSGFITVFKTDGTTEFEQIAIITSASAELITTVS